MGFFDRFRQKTVADEPARRARLLRTGRIAEGTILDTGADESGTVRDIFYQYKVNTVDYESSQTLEGEQLTRLSDYMPGARITVRYDPHQPGNSVVV